MVSQVEVLSDREKELLSNYDSRLFGFLRLQDPICDPSLPNLTHQSLLRKGVHFFEEELQRDCKRVHPTVYCRLGHYHLLLEEFPKALSAYQKFYNLQVDYWKDAPFLYGLGIVYFNFSAYQWAIKTFQQALYSDPGFSCSNEVHLRLGIMFKVQCNYEASVKHFHLALLDSNPCSLSKFEIRFHLGHIFEMQNKCQLAEEAYETIIEMANVPNSVKANAFKQLGWMYYNKEHLGDRTTRMQKAIQLLQKAIETDANSGSAWYLIGRCYAMQGKVHDAFTSYRQAIDKSEANADTWCSIGVLYQQQNQPMDALQAYVCAIQLDSSHVAAWTDLGILYEACNQPSDAVTCYNYARRYGATDSSIEARVKALQAELAAVPAAVRKQSKRSLPSIEEAWKLPIPAELTTRTIRNAQVRMIQTGQVPSYLNPQQQQQLQQMYLKQQQQQAQTCSADTQSTAQLVNTTTTLSVDDPSDTFVSQPVLTVSVSSANQYEHHNGVEQQTTCETSDQTLSSVFTAGPTPFTPSEVNSISVTGNSQLSAGQCFKPLSVNMKEPSSLDINDHNKMLLNDKQEVSLNGPSVSDELMEAITSEDSTSFTPSSLELTVSTTSASQTTADIPVSHDLLSSTSTNFNPSSVLTGSLDPTLGSGAEVSNSEGVTLPAAPLSSDVSISPFSSPSYTVSPIPKLASNSSFSPITSQPLSINPVSACLSPGSGLHGSHLLSPSLISPNPLQLSPSQNLSLLSPSNSKSLPNTDGQIPIPKISLLLDENAIPTLPKVPSPPLPTDKLSPQTPSIFVENKRDAMSPVLQNLCMSPSQSITVIRGLAAALKLDLSLFSTKTLVETNGDHQVEVRTQLNQASDENWDVTGEKKVWVCESSRSYSTIAKYAQYQANTFQDSLRDERNRQAGMSQSDSDSSSSSKSTIKKGNKKFKLIKFGTNVDLSDERKWKIQLQELTKLPPFSRVVAPGNMLSHVGHTVLGMNSVQLYMKIPGCRTPGHQENINFCSVNINIGPGDCEWFATPYEYWGVLANMCEKNNVNFLTGSWWPVLEDLYEERVPVYRFIQRPGDMVWINGGVPHWVQALGWCNNIAWNVGPLTEYMYNIAVERYEWNKLQSEKSIIGVIHLTWNLARNIRITERRLYEHIKLVLKRTLKYCQATVENLRRAGIEVIWHGKRNNEPVHYCSSCDVEVFNYLFVTNNKKHLVHCQDCARKTSSVLEGFIVLNQYKVEELLEVYNNFRLFSHGAENIRPPNQVQGPLPDPTPQIAS